MNQPSVGTRAAERSPRVSLKARITLWVLLIFALIQATTQGVFVLHQRSTVNDQFSAELGNSAKAAANSLGAMLPEVTVGNIYQVSAQELRFSRFETVALDVFDSAGRSIVPSYTSGLKWSDLGLIGVPSDDMPLTVSLSRAEDAAAVRPELARAVVVGVTGGNGARYAVVLASSDQSARKQLALVTQLAVISSVIGLFAAGLSARLIAGMAVAPLERLRNVAKTLGPESIGQRVELEPGNTEVARLSEELDRARIRIQDSMVAKERFLSNVSHEFKTPIAVLLLEAQTVDRTNCPESIRRFMETVEEEMTRLGKLVESFLTLTRIQSGRGPATLKRYCVNDLVSDSISNCSLMAQQHHVTLVPVLLSQEETLDAAVIGDPDLLRTLVENLIRNSIRFSPDGGRVHVIAEVEGEGVVVRVQDEGTGIPADRLSTIFDRFAQAHSSERQGRGHGLGLAIAKGIAELHGGTLEAFNREVRGCEFVIRVRLAQPGSRVIRLPV